MSRDILYNNIYIYISWVFLFFGFLFPISFSAWMKKRNRLALHGIPKMLILVCL